MWAICSGCTSQKSNRNDLLFFMSGSLFPSQKASDLLEFPTLEIYDLYPKIRVGTLLFHSLLLHSCEEWIVSIALKEQLAQNKQIALYTFFTLALSHSERFGLSRSFKERSSHLPAGARALPRQPACNAAAGGRPLCLARFGNRCGGLV